MSLNKIKDSSTVGATATSDDPNSTMDETLDESMIVQATGSNGSSNESSNGGSNGSSNESSNIRDLVGATRFFLPKVEPLPWGSFSLLTGLCIFPSFLYIVGFTQMGFGTTVYYYLARNFSQYSGIFGFLLFVLVFFLYIFDVDSWNTSEGKKARRFFVFVVFILIGLFGLFDVKERPALPLAIFAYFTPIWLIFSWWCFFYNKPFRVFVSWLSGPLLLTSVISSLVFLAWILFNEENRWGQEKWMNDAIYTNCFDENYFEDYSDIEIETESKTCKSIVFIVWVGPLLVGMNLFFLSFFTSFCHSTSESKDVYNFLKLWVLLMFVFWVTVSFNGASNLIMSTLITLTLTAFVGSAFFLQWAFSRDDIAHQQREVAKMIEKKIGGWMDVLRGLIVVTCLPFGVVYAMMAFVNQAVRKIGMPCSKQLIEVEDQRSIFTSDFRKKWAYIMTWDTVKVIKYAIYWGIAYMSMVVIAAEFVVLFLGWLISEVKDMDLLNVTLIMALVGLSLFMNPVIPGVPIYMTLGIVVPAIARDMFGLIWATVYCICISLIIKLLACIVQQKLIGEFLSKYTVVRKMIMINSSFTRAMKVILSTPGFSIAKVTILVGGPDWPTSVLCGILKLDLFQVLLGTLPVVFLITPTVLSGTLLFMASAQKDGKDEFPWANTAAAFSVAATAGVQAGSSIVAAMFVERALTSREDEINSTPLDEEVKKLEDDKKEYYDTYAEVTKWKNIPWFAKTTLILSLATMILSCDITTLFIDYAFAEFQLTDSIEEKLNGYWLNFILIWGWVALGLFSLSMIFYGIFSLWVNVKIKKIMQQPQHP